jgi:hypothetical protein
MTQCLTDILTHIKICLYLGKPLTGRYLFIHEFLTTTLNQLEISIITPIVNKSIVLHKRTEFHMFVNIDSSVVIINKEPYLDKFTEFDISPSLLSEIFQTYFATSLPLAERFHYSSGNGVIPHLELLYG